MRCAGAIAQVLPAARVRPEIVIATAVIVVERGVHDRRRAQRRGRRRRRTAAAQLVDDVFEHRPVRLRFLAGTGSRDASAAWRSV